LKKVRPHAAGKDQVGNVQAAHFEHFPRTRPRSGTLERREWDRKHNEFNNASVSNQAMKQAESLAESEGVFSPPDEEEARKRVLRSIVWRRGQPQFRTALLVAYGGRCCVTGTDSGDVLEAAHIKAYSKDGANAVTNGLLLRADIHLLFDLRKLSIDPTSHRVFLSKQLRSDPTYGSFHGKKIALPNNDMHRPDVKKLRNHFVSARRSDKPSKK